MSKKNWFIGGISILLFIVIGIYFFFPSSGPSKATNEKELKVSFLEVDPRWADSIIGTLSIEEKAAMLIMYQPNKNLEIDSMKQFLQKFSPGGYLFSSRQIINYKNQIDISKSLLFANYYQIPVAEKIKFQAPDIHQNTIFGSPEIFFSITDDSIIKESKQILTGAANHYSIDGIIFPEIKIGNQSNFSSKVFNTNSNYFYERIKVYNESLLNENVLTATGNIQKLFDLTVDTNFTSEEVIKPYEELAKCNFPIFILDSTFNSKKVKANEIEEYLLDNFKFRGLIFAQLKSKNSENKNSILKLILGGVDLLITTDIHGLQFTILQLISSGKLKENIINAKIKRILLAKTWSLNKKYIINYSYKRNFNYLEQSFPRRIRKKAITLLKNAKNYIPITNVSSNKIAVIHFGHKPKNFVNAIYKYLPREQSVPSKNYVSEKEILNFNPNDFSKYNTVIITFHKDVSKDKSILEKLKTISSKSKLLLINFENYSNTENLSIFHTLIQCWSYSPIEIEFSAQALFGALNMNAINPITKNKIIAGKKFNQCRLQYTIPEDIGISSDSLNKIEYIVNEGIRNRAFPAAQVFFALDGMVFYNKSFGSPTYTERAEVKTTDLFDMASVTKVAASTIIAMDLYEKGAYKLNDSLYKFIPDTLKKHIHGKSTLRNITFQQILIHATGLAAGQPILKYIRYRDSLIDKKGRFDKYYCDYIDDYYKIIVADKFYMEREQADTIWYAMNRMSVDEYPSYRYSDANMNLLYKLLNPLIKNRWKYYLDSIYYKPLGMFNSYYTPIEFDIKPERIIPTENDRYWRKQLLRGYVHDPTAALFGGVAGNAGLFSTAEDIGILFQMLMYKGYYGGKQYLKKETVELFISQQPGSHRGLGFNRQVKGNTYGVSPYASKNTFGHTGFTGISVWADMDINLLYVSCTNRVHPDPDNNKIIQLGTTKRIHNVIYEQLKYIMPEKISIEKY